VCFISVLSVERTRWGPFLAMSSLDLLPFDLILPKVAQPPITDPDQFKNAF